MGRNDGFACSVGRHKGRSDLCYSEFDSLCVHLYCPPMYWPSAPQRSKLSTLSPTHNVQLACACPDSHRECSVFHQSHFEQTTDRHPHWSSPHDNLSSFCPWFVVVEIFNIKRSIGVVIICIQSTIGDKCMALNYYSSAYFYSWFQNLNFLPIRDFQNLHFWQ